MYYDSGMPQISGFPFTVHMRVHTDRFIESARLLQSIQNLFFVNVTQENGFKLSVVFS